MSRYILLGALVCAVAHGADFGPEVRECPAPGRQEFPDVAKRDGRALVAWREVQTDTRTVAGRTLFGVKRLDGGPQRVAGESATRTSPPALAACPDGFALAWAEPERIVVVRLDPDGKPKRTAAIAAVNDVLARPALGCDDGGAFVAWSIPGKAQLAAARDTGDGKPRVLFADDAPGSWRLATLAPEPDGYRLAWVGLSGAQPSLLSGHVGFDFKARAGLVSVPLRQLPMTLVLARAASGGFLLAWDGDGQAGPVSAVRLRPDGSLLDPEPKVLSSSLGWSPSVTADGDTFTVAWTAWKGATVSPLGDTGAQLHAARLSAAGGASDPFVLHADAGNADQVRLAAGGLAVFTGGVAFAGSGRTSVSATDIWARTGSEPPVLVTRGPGQHRSPAMASRGAETLLAWVDDCGHPEAIRAARIGGGKLLGEFEVNRGASPARGPAVAAGPDGWLVAWVAPQAIYASRVSAAGALIDAKPLKVGDGAAGISAAWHGDGWVLAWHANNAVVSVRVPVHGVPEGFAPVRVGEDTFGSARVAVACAPPQCLAAWHNYYDLGSIPVTQRMPRGAPELNAQYPQRLDETAGSNAALAAGTDAFLFAWLSGRAERANTVLARRVPLQPGEPGKRLELGDDARYGALATTFDGRRFAVGWQTRDENDSLRWSWEDGRAQSLQVRGGTELALSGGAGAGLLAAWVEEGRVRVRELAPATGETTSQAAPVAVAPVRIAELFTLTRAAVAGQNVDALLAERTGTLMKNLQAVTGRGRLPVSVTLSRTKGREGPITWSAPGGGTISTGGPGRLSIVEGRFIGRECSFSALFGAVVLCDGPVKAGTVNDSIIIATGSVYVAHSDSSVVIAKGRIEVSHDGSQLEYGRGFASTYLSGERIEGSFLRGTVAGAADGVAVSSPNGVALLNTPLARPKIEDVITSDAVILDDAKDGIGEVEVAVQGGNLPERAGAWIFSSGASAFGREGQGPVLDGWRVAFVTPGRVLLRREGERLMLAPKRGPQAPPRDAAVRVPPEAEIHQVGAYEPRRADSVIPVEVSRPGKQVMLVLGAYESVTWDVRASKGTQIIGVLLGGYHAPDGVAGLEPGTPVVTRVHDYGEPYFYDYPGASEAKRADREVRALTDRVPQSFQGAEKLDRAVIK